LIKCHSPGYLVIVSSKTVRFHGRLPATMYLRLVPLLKDRLGCDEVDRRMPVKCVHANVLEPSTIEGPQRECVLRFYIRVKGANRRGCERFLHGRTQYTGAQPAPPLVR